MDTRKILSELRSERIRIDQAIAAIESLNITGSTTGRRGGSAAKRGRRRISAAGRKRLSELLKKRWASGKMKGRRKAKPASKQKQRGGITAAGRKRLSEMMKQRWAAKRKQAKTA